MLSVGLDNALEVLTISSNLNNSGTVAVDTGELRLGWSGTHSGDFTGSDTGLLNFSGGLQTFDAGTTITASQVRFSNQSSGVGVYDINGTYEVGETTVIGNTVEFNSAATTGTLTQTGGILSGTDTLTVTGLTTFSTGIMSGEGTTRAEGGLLLNGGLSDIHANRTLVNVSGQTANWTESFKSQ
ncbi:MAG: hypothetical protein P8171_25170 [Candidatus Thiodiazotropha sp.]